MISSTLKFLIRNNNPVCSAIKRNIFQSVPNKCYESGKTVATILNTEADLGLMINAYSEVGFRLNNDITVIGPTIIFPRSVLSWKVNEAAEITEESLSLFTILEPKIDILVLGIGDDTDKLPKSFNILRFIRKHNINIEILPTSKACPTFNFLNYEGRYVVGAFIPPTKIDTTDNDILQSKLRYQNLYEQDRPLLL